MKTNQMYLLIMLSIIIAGCSNNERRAELQNYVNKIKSRQIKEIEPLPEVKPYETFTYSDTNLRSPFMPSTPVEVAKNVVNDNGIHPDTNRRKEPLESFPLDSLRMMGTLEKNGRRWAIVEDTDGTVHRISKGNFVGQHDGKVEDITEEKVIITEIIPDGSGGWRERKAQLALVDQSELQKKTSKK